MNMVGRRPFFREHDVIEAKFVHFVMSSIVFCIIEAKFVMCIIASCLWLATKGPSYGFDRVPGGVLTSILIYLAGVSLTLFSPLRNLGRKRIMFIAFLLILFLIRLNTTASFATSEYNH